MVDALADLLLEAQDIPAVIGTLKAFFNEDGMFARLGEDDLSFLSNPLQNLFLQPPAESPV
jgi:hypothetical protein